MQYTAEILFLSLCGLPSKFGSSNSNSKVCIDVQKLLWAISHELRYHFVLFKIYRTWKFGASLFEFSLVDSHTRCLRKKAPQ